MCGARHAVRRASAVRRHLVVLRGQVSGGCRARALARDPISATSRRTLVSRWVEPARRARHVGGHRVRALARGCSPTATSMVPVRRLRRPRAESHVPRGVFDEKTLTHVRRLNEIAFRRVARRLRSRCSGRRDRVVTAGRGDRRASSVEQLDTNLDALRSPSSRPTSWPRSTSTRSKPGSTCGLGRALQ